MSALSIIAAISIMLGLASMTVSVLGTIRLRDTYLRLHAAANSAVSGAVLILAGSLATGEPHIIIRAALVALFVLLTAPVSAHAIGQAEYRRRRGEPQAEDDRDPNRKP